MADLNNPDTLASLQDLQSHTVHPLTAISTEEIPPAPTFEEHAVIRAVKRLNPHSASGPDRMSPRLLNVLVMTPNSPAARQTGLGTLTRLVRWLAHGDIPEPIIPLISAETLHLFNHVLQK